MSTKPAILFVDDEPRILSGLGRMLRSMRHEWEMAFASGGAEALQLLAARAFDVIVSDMRMPGMDGVALLGEVRRRCPSVARIALSGQASRQTVLASIGLVHQYLAKPCEAGALKAVLTRLCELRRSAALGDLAARVSAMQALPSLPSSYHRLRELLDAPEVSANDVARTVSEDPALSARVSQLVSSPFFAQTPRVPGPAKAAAFLGLDILKALAGSERAVRPLEADVLDRVPVEAIVRHSRTVAHCAKAIAAAETDREEVVGQAFLAGLLHDVGKLIFAAECPEAYERLVSASPRDSRIAPEAEQDRLGARHDRLGGYLLALWGLPEAVVEAVRWHHDPSAGGSGRFGPLAAVHAANALVQAYGPAEAGSDRARLDEAYLAGLGLAGRIAAWRPMALAVVEEAAAMV